MSASEKYKGIVIGCGRIGALFEADARRSKPATHAGALSLNEKTELSALVDTDEKKLAVAAALFPHARTYSDLALCLKEIKPDIAIVATDPSSHKDIIQQCADASVPMIIGEKPLSLTAIDGEGIRKIVENSSAAFVLNYQRRFFPLFQNIRTELAAGKLGKIQQISCYYSNGTFNNAGHAIDSLLYLLQKKVVYAIGLVNSGNATHPQNDQNIDGMLFLDNHAVITLQSFDQNKYGIHELRIYGEKGAVYVRDFGYTVEWVPLLPSSVDGLPQLSPEHALVEHAEVSMTAGALDEVLALHEDKRKPRSDALSGLETLAVLNALRESAQKGGEKVNVRYTQ